MSEYIPRLREELVAAATRERQDEHGRERRDRDRCGCRPQPAHEACPAPRGLCRPRAQQLGTQP
jgi:hypothetical protein